MSSREETIKKLFNELIAIDGNTGQRIHKRIDKDSQIPIYAACIFPSKHLILEIGPIKKRWLSSGFRKPSIKGLYINLEPVSKGPDGEAILLLELQQNESIDVFAIFMARICDELDKVSSHKEAIRSVIALLEKWKDFFSRNSEVLEEARQTGLYGELYLLLKFFNEEIDVGSSVRAWTGSRRTSQDFQFNLVSVEVKSSAAVDATTISITNARQLDSTGVEALYLCHILLDARQGIDDTLPKLIEEIRDFINIKAPDQSLDFEEKLIDSGYQDKHIEHYSNRAYSEREIEFYAVKEGFPRLLESDLPTGIIKVSYDLSLETCCDFKVEVKTAIETLRKYCDREPGV
jgi:hypothetical protein